MTLLDTPGHKDFSEDTYRALIAADSVVMVIDAANGVEAQTRKLFEVCRRHRLPILTFINKFDRPARDPLELLDDIESTLGISAAPVNWPVGNAEHFRGVYDICSASICCSTSARRRGSTARRSTSRDLDDPQARELIGENTYAHFRESLDVIRVAGTHVRHRRLSRRDADAGVLRQRADQLRPRAVPARAGRARAARRSRGRATPASSSRPTSASPASSSRSRRTWIRGTATASPSSASARASSPRTWRCRTAAPASRSARRAPTASSAAIARRSPRPTPATSSAWSTPGSSRSATPLHTGAPLRVPRHPALSGGALRRACGCRTRATSSSTMALRQLEEEGLMQVFYVDERPPRADRRRRRRAAVRRDQEPAADRVRRRDRRRSVDVHGRALGGRSGQAAAAARRRDDGGGRPPAAQACCCSPTSGKCSTSRSRTRRSPCSPNRRSPDALRFTRDQKTRRLTFQEVFCSLISCSCDGSICVASPILPR